MSHETLKPPSDSDSLKTAVVIEKSKMKALTEDVKTNSRTSISRDHHKESKGSKSSKKENENINQSKKTKNEDSEEISIEQENLFPKIKEFSHEDTSKMKEKEKDPELFKPLHCFKGDNVAIIHLLDFVSKSSPDVCLLFLFLISLLTY